MMVEKELGRQRRKEARQQNSYGPDPIRDGVSMSKQSLQEPIVDYDSVMCLPDLACYVRLIGEYPVVKLSLTRKETKAKFPGLIERNFDDSLDPKIEKLITHNEGSDAALAALFAAEAETDPVSAETPYQQTQVEETASVVPPVSATIAPEPTRPAIASKPMRAFSPLDYLKKTNSAASAGADGEGESLEKKRNQQSEEGNASDNASATSRIGGRKTVTNVIPTRHEDDYFRHEPLPEDGDMVQAMLEEEKNILRHHRPDEVKYDYSQTQEQERDLER